MLNLDIYHLLFFLFLHIVFVKLCYLREFLGKLGWTDATCATLSTIDGRAEHYGTMHLWWIFLNSSPIIALDALGKSVDATNKFGIIIRIQLCILLDASLQFIRQLIFRDCQDKYLVIGQQAKAHCLTESDAVKLLAINTLIVHAPKDKILLFGIFLHAVLIVARRGSHIEAFGSLYEIIVMNFRKVAFAFILRFSACCSVRLVAYDIIELAKLAVRLT